MWDKKRPDAATPAPPPRSATTTGMAPATSAAPAAGTLAPSPGAASLRGPVAEPAGFRGTSLTAGTRVVGDIYCEEDIYVDGEVKGKLDVQDGRLTVGPHGKAQSDVKAREVVILGKVQGDVEASQKITIRSTGSLVGNIRTMGIVIDDDAYFKGSIEIVNRPGKDMPPA